MLLSPARGPSSDPQRLQSLDALRALAVLLVIGHHTAWRFRPAAGDALAQLFKGSGWIGVDIFFVISGFMITTILLRDTGDIRGFFIRRFYRIVPIFMVAIATFVTVAAVTGMDREKLLLAWSPALFLNGWTIPFLGYGKVPYTIAWSLSVEETAYIILGLACIAHARGLRNALLGFILLAPMVRVAVLLGGWFNDASELYYFVPARLDSIGCGGLAALALSRTPYRARRAALAGCAMFGLVWIFQYTRIGDPRLILVGYSLFAMVTALFVLWLAVADLRAPQRPDTLLLAWLRPVKATVATFGKLSYFIYLFHIFVLEALLLAQRKLHVPLGFWPALLLATLIVFGLAAISWKYFEYPLIQLGRRKGARRTDPVPVPLTGPEVAAKS